MSDDDLERRLRQALSARASTVTRQDLRPAADPSHAVRRGLVSRWWMPLSAGVAAAAVLIAALSVLHPSDPVPAPLMPGSSPSSEPALSPSPFPAVTPSQAAAVPTASTKATGRPAPRSSATTMPARPATSLSPTKVEKSPGRAVTQVTGKSEPAAGKQSSS